jgi:hypothetical protein
MKQLDLLDQSSECPLASTPGDGSRSTWGNPKTALPPLLGETPAYPPLAPQFWGTLNSGSPHPSRSPLPGERSKDEAFYSWGDRGAKIE